MTEGDELFSIAVLNAIREGVREAVKAMNVLLLKLTVGCTLVVCCFFAVVSGAAAHEDSRAMRPR